MEELSERTGRFYGTAKIEPNRSVPVRFGCRIALRVSMPSATEGTDVPKYLFIQTLKARLKYLRDQH